MMGWFSQAIIFGVILLIACGNIAGILLSQATTRAKEMALRRAVGYTLVIMLLAFLAFAMWGQYVPGKLQGREVDMGTIAVNLALDSQALLGIPLKIGTTIVFAFVFMGRLLFLSGGSSFFTELAQALIRRTIGHIRANHVI